MSLFKNRSISAFCSGITNTGVSKTPQVPFLSGHTLDFSSNNALSENPCHSGFGRQSPHFEYAHYFRSALRADFALSSWTHTCNTSGQSARTRAVSLCWPFRSSPDGVIVIGIPPLRPCSKHGRKVHSHFPLQPRLAVRALHARCGNAIVPTGHFSHRFPLSHRSAELYRLK